MYKNIVKIKKKWDLYTSIILSLHKSPVKNFETYEHKDHKRNKVNSKIHDLTK